MDNINIKPYQDSKKSKKEQVAEMFNNIALRYDFLNHFLSFGIDKLWRRRAINLLKPFSPLSILDVATGTGDLAIQGLECGAKKITGVDISEDMLKVGQKKIEALNLHDRITLLKGDSESLQFENGTFDAVTVAFGVRNFENLNKGLAEMRRVLKPRGVVCILEFSKPRSFPFKQFYYLYSFYLLPFIGRLVSKDASAYRYLPESVDGFPDGNKFLSLLIQSGFSIAREYRQTFGIATIYLGIK